MKTLSLTTILTVALSNLALLLPATSQARGTTSSGGGANVCFTQDKKQGLYLLDLVVGNSLVTWDQMKAKSQVISPNYEFEQVDILPTASLKHALNQVLSTLDDSSLSRHIRKTALELKPFAVNKPFNQPLNADFTDKNLCSPENTFAVFYYTGDGLYLSIPLWNAMTFSAQMEARVHEALRITQIQTNRLGHRFIRDEDIQEGTKRIFAAYAAKKKVSLAELFPSLPYGPAGMMQASCESIPSSVKPVVQVELGGYCGFLQRLNSFDYDETSIAQIRSETWKTVRYAATQKSVKGDFVDEFSQSMQNLYTLLAVESISTHSPAIHFATFSNIPVRLPGVRHPVTLQSSHTYLEYCRRNGEDSTCHALRTWHKANVAEIVE